MRRRPDALIVEEPLTIELDGTTVTTTMRTPGHDYELAAGDDDSTIPGDGPPPTGTEGRAHAGALSEESENPS